jgi:hypothetical protein
VVKAHDSCIASAFCLTVVYSEWRKRAIVFVPIRKDMRVIMSEVWRESMVLLGLSVCFVR